MNILNFYRELQLSTAELKNLISSSASTRIHYSLVLIAKVLFTLLFCIAFIVLYSFLFGKENSAVGVAILLFLMTFQSTDFDVSLWDSLFIFFAYFLILAFLPAIIQHVNPLLGFVLNFFGIFIIYLLGCTKVEYFNHCTLALGYLLVYGYPVSGELYHLRILSILMGAVLTCLVFFHKHYQVQNTRKIIDLLKEFHIKTHRSQWQIKSALAISAGILLGEILRLPNTMWAGIAAMSVLVPFTQEVKVRSYERITGTILGIGVFFVVSLFLPANLYSFIGTIGGFFLGFCTKYMSKVPLNTCIGLCVAVGNYGFGTALFARFIQNILGVFSALFISLLLNQLYHKFIVPIYITTEEWE